MGIHIRLREERERLGMSQEALGQLGGVRKQAQLLYEKGERNPDSAYLAAVAAAGVDVLYVLTAQRSQPLPAQAALPREQQALLNSYALCSAAAKKNLLQAAALLAAGASPSSGGVSVQVRGDRNTAAGRDIRKK